jgi:hypothetical protein
MIYIKVDVNNMVTLAGEVADDNMLASGYFPYNGDIPQVTKTYEKLVFSNNVVTIVEDANLKAISDYNDRKVAMKTGSNYTLNGKDYLVSFTSDDANGLMQYSLAIQHGVTNTVLKFSNGTTMPITDTDLPAFGAWFVTQRNNFFLMDSITKPGMDLTPLVDPSVVN